MAAEIFTGLSNLRMILNTETDGSSPGTRTLFDAIRYGLENILVIGYSTGDIGSATGDPPNDTTGVLTDTGASYSVDEHNGRTLVMTSGNAIGNFYTIDDTTATTIVCTGDNLYSDGVRSGDTYEIFFDLITHASGHTHDNVNSPSVVLADAQVTQAKLKTSTGSVNDSSGVLTNKTLPGGEYGFYPQVYDPSNTMIANIVGTAAVFASYTTNISIRADGGSTAYAKQRYVTSSGEALWVFILKEKTTGKTISVYQAQDHPCFGNGNRPELVPHPFPGFDSKKQDIIVVSPPIEMLDDLIARTVPIVGGGYLNAESLVANNYEVDPERPVRDIIEVVQDDFDLIENVDGYWPDFPVTVGLPIVMNGKIVNDYHSKVGEFVTPIKRIIKKPEYITPLNIKLKSQ